MEHGNDEAKRQHHLIMGPWDHVATFWPREQIDKMKFGPASVLDMGTIHAQWYDWVLKGGPKPEFLKNRVAYYLPGAEEWRYADSLEAVTSGSRTYHLASPGDNPQSVARAGLLDEVRPQRADPPDRWTYDPLDTRPGERELKEGIVNLQTRQPLLTPADSLELFGAGLVYETRPLEQPLDLAGYVRLRLWLSMDVPDTDFSARLYEITAHGEAIFLTQQLQWARYREGLDRERLVVPGEVTSFVLDDFDFFARRVAAGSRIRLVVSAINSLRYEKNYNTGGVVASASGKDARTAHVQLHHDRAYPSSIDLPLAAPSRTREGAGFEMARERRMRAH